MVELKARLYDIGEELEALRREREELIKSIKEKAYVLDPQSFLPTLRAKDFMTEEGFKLEEVLIAFRQELLKIVQDPLKRMQVIIQLFGDEGMRAVAALLAKNKEEALAYLEALKNTMDPEEYKKLRKQIEEGGYTGIEGMRKAMDEQASLQDRINKTMNTWKKRQRVLLWHP